MMVLPAVLQNLGLILAAGFVGALLARWLKLPALVGYLFGGVVVGALTAGRLAGDATLLGLANFGVAMLMFSLGVELSLGSFKNTGRIIILAALAQVAVTMGVITLAAVLLGANWAAAVFLGAALSLSSTAVVIKLLESTGRLGNVVGEISVTWMLVQDLLVVPFFFLLPVLAGQNFTASSLVLLIVKTALVLIFAGILGRKVGRLFLSGLTRTDTIEVLLLGLVVWVLASAAVSVWLGLTMSLGVFLAGIMLGETNHEGAILSLTRPIRDLFAAIFFTSLGLFLPPELALELAVPTVLIVVAILLLKFLVSLGILRFLGYHLRLAVEVSAPIAGVGEFAFLVMGLGRSLGIVNQWAFGLTVSLTLFSILATPAFTWATEKVTHRWGKGLAGGKGKESLKQLKNHVVLCGFGRVGSWVGEALAREKIPFVVIEYHHQALKQARALGADFIYGDATQPAVLEAAGVEKAKAVVITLPEMKNQELILEGVRATNPKAVVIARAHHERDRQTLTDLGAQAVIQPEFEASLSIIHRVLQAFDKPKEEVAQNIKILKKEFET